MRTVIVAFILVATVQGNALHADILYSEDFNGGSESLEVWTMATDIWPFLEGDYDVFGGEFVLSQPDTVDPMLALITGVDDLQDLDDVSIRTQAKLDGDSEGVGLIARYDSGTQRFYQGGYNPDGGRLYLGWNNPFYNGFITHDVDFDLSAGLNLRLDVIDNTLDLWAWNAGDSPPEEPQLSYTDDEIRLIAGPPGILFDTEPSPGSTATFQFIDVSDAPFVLKPPTGSLQPGDADRNSHFDQSDLVQVLIANKYLSGEPATWGEGDWNGAPGGTLDNPPIGDGVFDQLDVIRAVAAGVYLTGSYAAIRTGGVRDDGQASLVYNAKTGELAVDAPSSEELTSINIDSAGGKFIGDRPAVLSVRDPSLFQDNFSADNIFKATFGMSFGDVSFGNVLPTGLTEADIAADLSVVGSLAGGDDLGAVDLVHVPVPEPPSFLMLTFASIVLLRYGQEHPRRVQRQP